MEISVYRGEVKPLQLKIVDQNNKVTDLSGATLFLSVKRHHDDDGQVFFKDHADFDLRLAALGLVSVNLLRTDTNQEPGRLIGQVRAIISGKKIYSDEFYINIEASVIPGPFMGTGSGTIPTPAGMAE